MLPSLLIVVLLFVVSFSAHGFTVNRFRSPMQHTLLRAVDEINSGEITYIPSHCQSH